MSYTDLEDDDDFTNLDRGNEFDGSEDDEDEDEDQESEDDEVSDEDETEETDEDQEDEDTDEEDIEEEEPPVKQEKKSYKIPKERLDKALRQRDELRDRAAWLEEQLEKLIETQTKFTTPTSTKQEDKAPSFDFDKAEEDYANLLIEGDIPKATALRRTIDAERRKEMQDMIAEIKKTAVKEATDETNKLSETAKFQKRVQLYESKYTFLDADHDDYNEEAVDTVNTLLAGYAAKGIAKSEALKKAVEKVVPMFSKPAAPKKSIGQARKEEAGKKAVQAAKSQPSKTKSSTSTSIDATKLDIKKISDKDFAKLTPRELKALRGD